jgi:hypothetical protein
MITMSAKSFLDFIADNPDTVEYTILTADLENNTPSGAWRDVVRKAKITSQEALKQEQREVSNGELIIPNRLYAFFASEGC